MVSLVTLVEAVIIPITSDLYLINTIQVNATNKVVPLLFRDICNRYEVPLLFWNSTIIDYLLYYGIRFQRYFIFVLNISEPFSRKFKHSFRDQVHLMLVRLQKLYASRPVPLRVLHKTCRCYLESQSYESRHPLEVTQQFNTINKPHRQQGLH